MAPRTAQKNRTRAQLLDAARRVMQSGDDLTVARAADAAGISRATAYRYFSDPSELGAEATFEIELTPTEDLLAGLTDVRARVHAVARYYLDFTRENEAHFRQFMAQTMRQWSEGTTVELRGARRVAAFADALEPVRSAMDAAVFDDLVRQLSMLTGVEQHIALTDVLKVDEGTGDRLQAGIVDALLDKVLPGK